MTTSCRSGADLYRLTTRISERTSSHLDGGTACLDTVLAPLGIEVVRSEPAVGVAAEDGVASTTVINLTMPIDLPAIDYLLRASGHEVLELQPNGRGVPTA